MRSGLLLGVLAIMAALFSFDKFLATVEHNEINREADSLRSEGERLLATGQASASLVPLQRAYALVRTDRRSELSFARALAAAGKVLEADARLRHLLEIEPNDGAANLAMARLQVRRSNWSDAESFYHRAEYGHWKDTGQVNQVRQELVRFLADRGEQKALLSELLILEDESTHTLETQKQLAHLFLVAGSPARAAKMYRTILKREPDDTQSYVGLADTQLAAGNYPAALSSLSEARRLRPDDTAIVRQIGIATRLVALDPTPRRLRSKQKYERSLLVLRLIAADLAQCAARLPADIEVRELLALANAAEKSPPQVTNEMSESILAVAQELWKTRSEKCVGSKPPDTLLSLLMEKISQ